MELVYVAGMATAIHQTIPTANSLALPLTIADTRRPSRSATYNEMRVLNTRNPECERSNKNSFERKLGIMILINFRNRSKNALSIYYYLH